MSLLVIVIIVLLLVGVGAGPWWGYHQYGWGPSGIVGVLLVILLIYLLLGHSL